MAHQVGIFFHPLTITYAYSVICPQLVSCASLIHYNIPQRHMLSKRQLLKMISNRQLDKNGNNKRPPKEIWFIGLWVFNKNSINQISHILQRSTSQPLLQNLPLPPMLSQSQNQNLLPPNIPKIPVPAPRVDRAVKPLMVQTQKKAPTSSLKLKHSTYPSLDPH